MNKIKTDSDKSTKRCSKCERILPASRFSSLKGWCKNCMNTYAAIKKGNMTEDDVVKIKRVYKEPIPERILDTKQAGIKRINPDEYFVRLIDYRQAWVSNYGRVAEFSDGRYRVKRLKRNKQGELTCSLQKNIYADDKWVFQCQTIEVWRLVIGTFIVNYDIAGNTHCWHKDDDKSDCFYKHLYPVNERQYNAIKDLHAAGQEDTEELIFDIINDLKFKSDDYCAVKWKKSVLGIGYLGCNDVNSMEENVIYMKWWNMMQRCYDPVVHQYKPYYSPCTVCEEWHNFANFRIWYMDNCMGSKKLDLDKDILVQGNTVYSPETCTLISHFTNTIFEDRGTSTRIAQNSETGKYDVWMSVLGQNKEIGTFDTREEGKKAFLDYKQNYISEFAEKSKDIVPDKTYEAMINWKVKVG